MKKIFNLIIFSILVVILSSCGPIIENGNGDKNGDEMGDKINIYTVNDFHGAIFENQANGELGISKIGKFLKTEKEENPNNTVIISAGDMFQGTAVSSLTRGRLMVDLMNYIGFDAMALGNHEFDWGVEEIIRYCDGDPENGEANFPFLGANIFHKPTDDYVEWAEPYTIIERGELKIGIIGLMGEGLESSIIKSISQDYIFTSQMAAIKKYTPILRNEKGVDIVIVASHSDTANINREIRDLTGEYYVDAVINGHTHQDYFFEELRGDSPSLVGIQSGNNGRYVGHIELVIDLETKQVLEASAGQVPFSKLTAESSEIVEIINNYQEYLDYEFRVIGPAGMDIERNGTTSWAVQTMAEYYDADLGIINYGGMRSAGFPVRKGTEVTFGTIFKMVPFENEVIILDLSGERLLRLSSITSGLAYSLHPEQIKEDQVYRVAVLDYVYYGYDYIFNYGDNLVFSTKKFRDILVEKVEEIVQERGSWYI